MSSNLTGIPPRGVPQFSATFKCGHCDAEKPPILALNTMMPLDYFIGGKRGKISTLRTITVCGLCNYIISIQFLPVDIEMGPVTAQPPQDDGSRILV